MYGFVVQYRYQTKQRTRPGSYPERAHKHRKVPSMLNPIVPQNPDDLVDWMTCEIECLAAEVFATTYGCDWQLAIDTAFIEVVSLINYAEEWDRTQAAEQRTARQIALMRETGCTAEAAIDAVRHADGRPAWTVVMNGAGR